MDNDTLSNKLEELNSFLKEEKNLLETIQDCDVIDRLSFGIKKNVSMHYFELSDDRKELFDVVREQIKKYHIVLLQECRNQIDKLKKELSII